MVERALANDPGHRYASAGAMEQALAGSLGLTEVAPGTRDAPPVPQPRRWVVWISLGAAVASGNVLSGIVRNLSSRAERRRGIWTWQIQLQNPGG